MSSFNFYHVKHVTLQPAIFNHSVASHLYNHLLHVVTCGMPSAKKTILMQPSVEVNLNSGQLIQYDLIRKMYSMRNSICALSNRNHVCGDGVNRGRTIHRTLHTPQILTIHTRLWQWTNICCWKTASKPSHVVGQANIILET